MFAQPGRNFTQGEPDSGASIVAITSLHENVRLYLYKKRARKHRTLSILSRVAKFARKALAIA